MATYSHIEWTQMTWNPVTGCTKLSPGCKHCYAERMAKRLKAMGVARYRDGFAVTLHEDLLQLPFTWKRPRLVFVNSMSDLFHRDVPLDFIQRAFDTMERCPQHTFQVLTKRSDRLREVAGDLPWPRNIWMGVSVENTTLSRRALPICSRFPPPCDFSLSSRYLARLMRITIWTGIHWVIVGGESGAGSASPCRRRGWKAFTRSARRQTYRSSSSNGAGRARI